MTLVADDKRGFGRSSMLVNIIEVESTSLTQTTALIFESQLVDSTQS